MATPSRQAPATRCKPYPAGEATPLSVTVNDQLVLVIARRLHDEKCIEHSACHRRDGHALGSFDGPVRKTLGAMISARAAQEV